MAKKVKPIGDIEKCLLTEKFHGLSGELASWRMNPGVTRMDKQRDKGRILGFIKGLRFSARIAYLVRDILATKNIHVSWGHLVNDEGTSCSAECDIIIHKPGWLHKWNQGGKHPIMDFKFIRCSEAIAVISCKSLTRSIDKDYCKGLKPYNIKKVFLFSECCSPVSTKRLTRQAKEAGYSDFFYLYTVRKDSDTFAVNEEGILEFIIEVEALLATIPC